MKKSRLSGYKQGRLIEHFVSGSTARTATCPPRRANLVGVNKPTVACYFHRLREIIALELGCEGGEDSSINPVSIEDAHCCNDLRLLEKYAHTTVILGVVTIASSKIETVEQIRTRLKQACEHIDKERLMAAPDCGLIMLGRELAMQKLSHLCQAAHSL